MYDLGFGGDDGSSWGLFSDVGVGDNTYDLSDAYNDSLDFDSPSADWTPSGSDYLDTSSITDVNDLSSPGSSYTGGPYSSSLSMPNGADSGTGIPWNAVLGVGSQLLGGYMQGQANQKLTKEEEAMKEKLYAFQKAEDEKYYQLHGKQLADAYQGYKQYYQAPGLQPSATAQFGLVSPGGPSGYFK
jgi:hypothetical protein